jgi:hypothetical protein
MPARMPSLKVYKRAPNASCTHLVGWVAREWYLDLSHNRKDQPARLRYRRVSPTESLRRIRSPQAMYPQTVIGGGETRWCA